MANADTKTDDIVRFARATEARAKDRHREEDQQLWDDWTRHYHNRQF
jgi:hypothetical protein